MFTILVIDPNSKYPQYDIQQWAWLTWKGTSHPQGKWLGEWVWVGRSE